MSDIPEQPRQFGTDICDSHHHLYESGPRSYSLDDFQADVSALPITRSVYVECGERYRKSGPREMRCVGETEWVAAVSGSSVVAAIVAYADLAQPSIADVLAKHTEAGNGKFRGIRQMAAWDAAPGMGLGYVTTRQHMLTDPNLIRGVQLLAKGRLTFDAFVYQTQLTDVVDLARAAPEAVIVLNHAGGLVGVGPYRGRRQELASRWRNDMAGAARCQNIVLKIGGFGRPAAGFGWDQALVKPGSLEIAAVCQEDVVWMIEQFGPERCMFESDFPVDRSSFSYEACWNAFDRMAVQFSPSERHELFYGTAARTYAIDS